MKNQTVRIIAGHFRSRKIHFPDIEGLRPTPDRVKETLFNWLQTSILGATCLDLFAGSGALGFDAASRGAADVVMVDSSKQVVTQLQKTIQELKLENVEVFCAAFPNIQLTTKFDIVFLDPPFHQNLVQQALDYLVTHSVLKKAALIYIETEKTIIPTLPKEFELLKESTAGDVRFQLLKFL